MHEGLLSYHSPVLMDLIKKAKSIGKEQEDEKANGEDSHESEGDTEPDEDTSGENDCEYIELDLPESDVELEGLFSVIYNGGDRYVRLLEAGVCAYTYLVVQFLR